MENKPGFKTELFSENMLYIIIGIIIFVFTLFMPRIYKFISTLKTGQAFKRGEKPPIVDTGKTENKPTTGEKIENLSGTQDLICTSTNSTADGNLVETYTFYYTDENLTGIKNEKNYDAISDEYLNFAYLEQSKFENINSLYKNVPGFSYKTTFENRNLIAVFSYDLNKLNPENLKNEDKDLTIELNVKRGQTIDEVKTAYSNLGFVCK